MNRRGRITDLLFFATIFTVTFAKLQWEVAGTLSLSDVLTAFFLVAFVGNRMAAGDRRFAYGAVVAAGFFILPPLGVNGSSMSFGNTTCTRVTAPPSASSLTVTEGSLASSLTATEGSLASSLTVTEGSLASSLTATEGSLASSLTVTARSLPTRCATRAALR